MAAIEGTAAPQHARQLDSLRAIAAIAVIFHHEGPFAESPFFEDFGSYGVALFFVLSGFLITGILLRSRDEIARRNRGVFASLRTFYARRSLRIFPLYYAVLALLVVFEVGSIRQSARWHALYLSNVLNARAGRYLFPQHFWSLSVEEQFYLAWPLVVLLVPGRWLYRVILAMLVAGSMSRLVLFLRAPNEAMAVVLPTSCMDLLGLGCLLAYLRHEGVLSTEARRGLARIGLIVGCALMGVQTILSLLQWGETLRIAVWSLPSALIAFWLVDRAVEGFAGLSGRLLAWPPLVYLGTISYGLYVYHMFMGYVLRRLGVPFPTTPGMAKFLVVLCVTTVVASASWHFFESPVNSIKRYFPYASAPRRTAKADPRTGG